LEGETRLIHLAEKAAIKTRPKEGDGQYLPHQGVDSEQLAWSLPKERALDRLHLLLRFDVFSCLSLTCCRKNRPCRVQVLWCYSVLRLCTIAKLGKPPRLAPRWAWAWVAACHSTPRRWPGSLLAVEVGLTDTGPDEECTLSVRPRGSNIAGERFALPDSCYGRDNFRGLW